MATASQLLTFCIQSELVCQLGRFVGATGRERSYHLRRALERYFSAEVAHAHAVKEGIREVEAGKLWILRKSFRVELRGRRLVRCGGASHFLRLIQERMLKG